MTPFDERCAHEDELDRRAALEALRATAKSQPWVPLLPSCPPHLLFLCVEDETDVAGCTTERSATS